MATMPLTQPEHDCLMNEVQIRSNTTTNGKNTKKSTFWLKAQLCQNRFTLGLCLSLVLSITIVISLLFLYALHLRIRAERKHLLIKLLQFLIFFNQ